MLNAVETRNEAILESIRPALETDGENMEFLRFDEEGEDEEGEVVDVRLLGCPVSNLRPQWGAPFDC